MVAVIVSWQAARKQNEHNMNSVRPILNIELGDYERDIHVSVANNGVGPAISVRVLCPSDSFQEQTSSCLVDLIPPSATLRNDDHSVSVDLSTYTDFVFDISGRAFPPGGQIILLKKAVLIPCSVWRCESFCPHAGS